MVTASSTSSGGNHSASSTRSGGPSRVIARSASTSTPVFAVSARYAAWIPGRESIRVMSRSNPTAVMPACTERHPAAPDNGLAGEGRRGMTWASLPLELVGRDVREAVDGQREDLVVAERRRRGGPVGQEFRHGVRAVIRTRLGHLNRGVSRLLVLCGHECPLQCHYQYG